MRSETGKPLMDSGPVRLLYIVGVSRSGSTILDAVLDSHPGICATGELYLLATADHGSHRICACGQPIETCSFWGPVVEQWERSLGAGGTAAYLELQGKFERYRQLPRILLEQHRRSPAFERYAHLTLELLRLVEGRAEGRLIADSSKHPPRVLALLNVEGIEIALIHLLRDPRGVVWSKLKFFRPVGGPKWLHTPLGTTVQTTFEWLLLNGTTEWLRRRHHGVPYVRIRYEDFASDPARELGRLGDSLGVDLSELAERAATGEPFSFGHIMAGNTARHRGPRPLIKDTDWQQASPMWMRRLVWLATWPLARHYGYRR